MNHFEFPTVSCDGMTLKDLNALIESNRWHGNSRTIQNIISQYLNLINQGEQRNLGNTTFWKAVSKLWDQDGYGSKTPLFALVDDVPNLESGPQQAIEADLPNRFQNFYDLHLVERQNMPRYQTFGRSYRLKFRNMESQSNVYGLLEGVFTEVLDKIKESAQPNDLVGFYLNQPTTMNQPLTLPYCLLDDLSAERLLSHIERMQQSNEDITFNDDMMVKFVHISRPTGSGYVKKNHGTFADCLKRSRHIIKIKNNDNLCLARALVVAKAIVDNDNHYHTLIAPHSGAKSTMQQRQALELMKMAGLGNHDQPCGFHELQKLQAILQPSYQIKVYAKEQFNELFYEGPMAQKVLHLYLHDGHFDVIKSMPGFFQNNYFCDNCNKSFQRRTDHKCKNKCKYCFCDNGQCMEGDKWINCNECQRNFPSQSCYSNHKIQRTYKGKVGKSICKQISIYPNCGSTKVLKRKHECGKYYCSTCNKLVSLKDHQCFIQKKILPKMKKMNGPQCYIFFDLETSQETPTDKGLLHKPMLCIAQKVCDLCKNNTTLTTCTNCGRNEHIFQGYNCMDQFCTWMFSEQNAYAIALAHNSKGFDGQFILKYMHENCIKPKIVPKGLELMCIESAHVKIIDSFNFLPMALSALPKAFGLTELKKGHFPHLFNREENWKYIGSLPPPEMYGTSMMKADDYKNFLQWYEKEKLNTFNFDKELIDYCRSDVDILRRCCMKFRDLFMMETKVDPFLNSMTIASACSIVYRTNHLPENVIGVVPYQGYSREKRQSIIAIKWLKWISNQTGKEIRHAHNGGEVQVGPYKVDGQCENEVFEFLGCYYHGCPDCFKCNSREKRLKNSQATMEDLYQRTMVRKRYLEAQGYHVTEMWECKLKAQMKEDFEMKQFFDNIKIMEPIDPREAFFGGRTNAACLYYKTNDGEKIYYTDICSLYPYICKYGRFPIGHPQIITENFKPIATGEQPYEGLIKCKVLPPQDLLHPVLPIKSRKKLIFALCQSCVDKNQKVCNHNEDERALTGTWVCHELYKAVNLGYRILEIYEVLYFEKYAQYNNMDSALPQGLFTQYMNDFLKLKQEADGWPSWVKTDDDKKKYQQEWIDKEGIYLDETKIEKNPGLRALAKLCLNSFWGKFGQRSNMANTVYFTNSPDYFKLINDPTIIIHSTQMVNENMILVTYSHEDDFVEILPNTNSIIAAYVTAQARLKLYSYIEQLQERVLYFDTDSIIYLTRPYDAYQIPTGNYLGEMTNEIEKDYGPSAYISEFVSGGPKNYAFKVKINSGEEKYNVKIRGFRLTHSVSQQLNFDLMKEFVFKFVLNNTIQSINVNYDKIIRTADRNVITKKETKKYKIVYDKRIVNGDFSTIPYSYTVSDIDFIRLLANLST